MEAATKNKKRGRPPKTPDFVYSVYTDKENRTAQNAYYAAIGFGILGDVYKDFFFTPKGKGKRWGILEQIGRMSDQNNYDEQSCKEIGIQAIELYKNGWTVKALERWIRDGRTTGQW